MYTEQELLQLARAYGAAEGISLRMVGRRIFGRLNDKSFDRLARGFGCYGETIRQASVWFNARADEAWWPAEISRKEQEALE